ncbi:MAG: acetate/propionate family kinase [Desulfobacterales bacterium]|nr:acetate/propionate family kinase [Desulfobacterales bacterium]
MESYLASSEIINWQHPDILNKAKALARGLKNPVEIASACFLFVRDEIRHSNDYKMNPVTCIASDVLKHKTGYCYAKSHLLAALLRANQIPVGLCYQRLTIENDQPPFCLHGLNAVYLPEFGWYRMDARGNKTGVNAEFCPPEERLAFPIITEGEADFPEIWPEPLPVVIKVLTSSLTYQDVAENLPDIEICGDGKLPGPFNDTRNRLRDSDPEGNEDPYGFELRTGQPVKLLVINCGSSSLKFTLFNTTDPDLYARGQVERIGIPGTVLTLNSSRGQSEIQVEEGTHQGAFSAMLNTLESTGLIHEFSEITAVAHRNTLGGEKHRGAVLITEELIQEVEGYSDLFPLHNPPIIAGIRAAQALLPEAVHVTVFDSSFHSTIPSFAHLYALPYAYYEEKGVRRFGYHGSSHKYASLKAAQFLKRPVNSLKTIVCHLGSGASLCAIHHGRSVDTTLGFSPLEGVIMGTRCGDLDPGLLLYLMKHENMGYEELSEMLSKQSGLLGMSGVSSDMREVEAAAAEGNRRAMLAIETYAYRVRKYIGGYVAALEDLDVLVFTGGIGQGSVLIRSLACQGLARMGIILDKEKNRGADGFNTITDITTEDSQVRVLVIPADEERMIARDTLATLAL